MKNKIVIGIDQSYTRTGFTVLIDKKIFSMKSINFDGCMTNTAKRSAMKSYIDEMMEQLELSGYDFQVDEYVVITERIRLRSQGFLSEAYINSTGALIATIIDAFADYNIPVYSVDTRSWKSQIVGNSKPLDNPYGINPEKYRTIVYLKELGLLKYIVEEYKGRGTKGVINVKIEGSKVPCKINDDIADSYCIAMYGYLPKSKQKLKEETF